MDATTRRTNNPSNAAKKRRKRRRMTTTHQQRTTAPTARNSIAGSPMASTRTSAYGTRNTRDILSNLFSTSSRWLSSHVTSLRRNWAGTQTKWIWRANDSVRGQRMLRERMEKTDGSRFYGRTVTYKITPPVLTTTNNAFAILSVSNNPTTKQAALALVPSPISCKTDNKTIMFNPKKHRWQCKIAQ